MNLTQIINDAHLLASSAMLGVWDVFNNSKTSIKILSNLDKDIKLSADVEISQYLMKKLSSTGQRVVSEEDHQGQLYGDDFYWLVDPLDGTFNYIREFPFYCCSIALVQGREPLYGQILNLHDGSIIYGGKTLPSGHHVGLQTHLGKAALASGFPLEFDFASDAGKTLSFYSQFKKIRMIGSAASSLCLIAKGTLDLYYEKNIYFWDVAAGLAIVEASGGSYKAEFQEDSWKLTTAAGNKNLIDMVQL